MAESGTVRPCDQRLLFEVGAIRPQSARWLGIGPDERPDLVVRFGRSPAITSTQRAVTHSPGFLWNGRVAMLLGIAAHVHDSYIAGMGTLHAAILGLFTVAQVQGDGEIARGELMRYFAEMAWYPTALLPSQGVRWAAVDNHSANATLVDGPISLTLMFKFDEAG